MRKNIIVIALFTTLTLLMSCASSKSTTTVFNGISIDNYRYIIFGNENNGDAELSDIIMMVQNELSNKLNVVAPSKAHLVLDKGEKILSPHISVKSEKWDGGHTYISINLYDYETNQSIAVIKSSGIGLSISHDQQLAISAIKKELNKVFK